MSKYFDQIVRTRTGPAPRPVELPQFPTLIERKDYADAEEAATSASAELEKNHEKLGLKGCHKVDIAKSALLHNRFDNSDSIGVVEESYRALRTRLLRLKTSQGVCAVQLTSATPGEGKTMTALNLAVSCAQLQEMSVLLLDADIRSKGLTRLLDMPPSPGLAEVLAGQAEREKTIVTTDIANLYFLPCGASDVAPPELFAGSRWQELMEWCKETFQIVIVDSPPMLGLSDSELISVPCDGALMVVRARQVKRDHLEKSAQQLDAKKLLGLVYNATEEGKRNSYYYGAPESRSSSANRE